MRGLIKPLLLAAALVVAAAAPSVAFHVFDATGSGKPAASASTATHATRIAAAADAPTADATTAGAGTAATGAATAGAAPLGEYSERAPHVRSTLNITGLQGVVRGEPSVPPPEEPPLPVADFTSPVHAYLAYSQRRLTAMLGQVTALETALRAGDRAGAQAAWRLAFASYLRLGAVYLEGPVATLNAEIDGTPGGLVGGTASPQFTGLHRLEFGLWTGEPLPALVPYASRLSANVDTLRTLLPHVTITPLEYATRAHEILEDAVRDLLSGTDVPWSGEGVLGTAAGLDATREVISTLKPLLHVPAAMAADPPANPRSTAVVDADLDQLQSVLDALRRAHGGTLPTNGELSATQSEQLDAAIGQALEGLAQIPGMLETTNPPATPVIPRSAFRIDP